MPSMTEIYERHAARYDELVEREDAAGSIAARLAAEPGFDGGIVCEFGAGTGRLTRLYLGRARRAYVFDRSGHMLEALAAKFPEAAGGDRLRITRAGHLEAAPPEPAAVFLEGWSFGHFAMERPEEPAEAAALLDAVVRRVLAPGGRAFLFETLGTGVEGPAAPHPRLAAFYRALEAIGYRREVLRTDYLFADPSEAARVCGFFFGEAFGQAVLAAGSPRVREFTGLWAR